MPFIIAYASDSQSPEDTGIIGVCQFKDVFLQLLTIGNLTVVLQLGWSAYWQNGLYLIYRTTVQLLLKLL